MAHDREIFGIDRRKAIITGIVGAVLAVAAVAAIGQVANFGDMLHALDRADSWWFPVCLGGEIAAYAGYIVAYRDTARVDGGPNFSLWTATRVVAIGFGAFVVGTSAGSLGLDFWALHRAGEPSHRAARRVLALNTVEWFVLASFAFISAVLVLAGWGSGAPLPMELAWLVIVPACVAGALWVSSPRRVDRLASLPHDEVSLERSPRTWLRWLWHGARAAFSDAVGGVVIVRHLVGRPLQHPGAVFGFPLYWAGDILTLDAALHAFGRHPAIAPLVLAYTTAYVVTALPLPAGGAGGIEASVAFSLSAVGIPLAPALLATLVYRVFTLWLPIVPALLALTQLHALDEELPDVPRTDTA